MVTGVAYELSKASQPGSVVLCLMHKSSRRTEKDKRTWCKLLKPLLYLRYDGLDVGWWSCPKDQAMAGIDKVRLNTGVLKPLKDGIEVKPFEVCS